MYAFVWYWVLTLGVMSAGAMTWGRWRDERERRRRLAAKYPLARDTIGDRRPRRP